ncbi:MAG: hypothetical protein N2C14_20785, partial [Planctomycetales bacterium]
VVIVVAATAFLGMLVAAVAIRTALIAEYHLGEFFIVKQACYQYIEQHDGAWPRSWDDLRKVGPEFDYEGLSRNVSVDFDADPRVLASQTPASFKAVQPKEPCFEHDHHLLQLIDLLKKYHKPLQEAEPSNSD